METGFSDAQSEDCDCSVLHTQLHASARCSVCVDMNLFFLREKDTEKRIPPPANRENSMFNVTIELKIELNEELA